ncbi:endo-1,4-beta-xylanase [Microbacterium sp. C23T]
MLRTTTGALGVLAMLAAGMIAPAANAATIPVLSTDFSDGTLGDWVPFGLDAESLDVIHVNGDPALRVSDRNADWSGIVSPAGTLESGKTYDLSMRVRLESGAPDSRARFVVRPGYAWVGDAAVTASSWTTVHGTYTVPKDAGDAGADVYIGTADAAQSYSYFVDDVQVSVKTSLKQALPFPVGVAIDQRETAGAAADRLRADFSQVTPENSMKPDAWYDAERRFRIDPQAASIMSFAKSHGLRVYGHTLVWHNQTPDWFFTDVEGEPLTSEPADRALLQGRLRDHIFGVARELSAYGQFGAGNPIVAFDVVNEVIDDGAAHPDGLRRSRWYDVLGEEFIDLAFQYADQAFNDTYAAAGADRPVALFVNDYGTEWSDKGARYRDLVERLLARHVPVGGVGHQFHVDLSVPAVQLETAIDRFANLPVVQAVTEFDVATGVPVDEARLAAQEQYYEQALAGFAARASTLFSVSVWGLTDDRSWRMAEGAPLLFDAAGEPKPAYRGVLAGGTSVVAHGVDVTASTRCVNKRVVLIVSLTSREPVDALVTVSTPYGTRNDIILKGRTRVAYLFSTRRASVPAGSASVAASAVALTRPSPSMTATSFDRATCG